MNAFLSPEWIAQLNERLREAGPLDTMRDSHLRVVFELLDAPSEGPNALSVTLASSGALATTAVPSERDVTLRISYLDAQRLYDGALDGARALREGRLKIVGDVATLVGVIDWLMRASVPATGE